ncbi:MAG: NADH-quinone oxidoreductase subunit C, partial [Candidatus Bathyarchaeota archaeon]|nr:NADH-quinone oxidoreductase subunit C [Candidatus Bathyarchaeota archaeon]
MDIPIEVDLLKEKLGDKVIEYGSIKPKRIYVKIDKSIVKDAVNMLVSQGYTHISTITGLDTGRGLEVLYHLDRMGSLITVRVDIPYDNPKLPSITDIIPGAVLYEGEVRDLFGVSFEGNPYPKPIVLPDGWPEGFHPLRKVYKVDDVKKIIIEHEVGAPQIEVEEGRGAVYIPIGPQHPALKEPIGLRFVVEGEYIVKVKARIGYNHRGIEKAMENQTYIQNLILTERICGICSVAHTQCYVLAVESALDLDIPERARYIRVVMNELNRIHSHMLWMG